MKQYILLISYLFCFIFYCQCAHNILDYGAVPFSETSQASTKNSNAFIKASIAANSSDDREVLVPSGYSFVMFSVTLNNLDTVTFTVDGKLFFSNDDRRWPSINNHVVSFMDISDSQNLHFRGTGQIDGRGYMWWWREILVINKQGRPHMFMLNKIRNLIFEGITLRNSPQFHINAKDVDQCLFQNFEIHVDVQAQKKLLIDHGHFDWTRGLPTFPLNTDGIDPSGTNVHIRNVTFTLFDDAVAVKPAHQGFSVAKCAQNILVENCTVNFAVGMTIGTVPPNKNNNCVRDVLFRNIIMNTPFKAIYVKTNPGSGTGIISNVTYENFQIYKPIWWGIYIGPQQQKQPDGGGPGCMLYPLNLDCPTQPLVTLEDITLRNITIHGSLLTPGIIRCHEDNPCRNIRFENVYHNAWYKKVGLGFIVENVYGESINSYPDPGFKRMVKEEV